MARGACVTRRGNRSTWLVAFHTSSFIRRSSQVKLNEATTLPSDDLDCRFQHEPGGTVSQHMAHVCPNDLVGVEL